MAYAFSEIASIYPITPSSTMAENADEWQSKNVKNLFGKVVKVNQLESEAGVSGAVHGSLSAGALTTTFTASQGLLLMIPNMYKIAGELLPTVFHVSARALSTHALSIFGDHQDVMAVRSTGFAMLCSNTVQEAQDMAVVAHLATLKSSVPFVHFFDGFRTSHEIQNIESIEYDDLQKILPKKEIAEFKARALSSYTPHQQGTAQNPDIYFQNREACNKYYNNVLSAVESSLKDLTSICGRKYEIFEYFGDKNATNVIVAMGSSVETIKQVVVDLNKTGKKYGVLAVRLYRPFYSEKFVKALPKSVKKVAVLDRTKESGADGEPLFKDVATALIGKDIAVVGGRYGLGGKEFTPAMAKGVFDNLEEKNPKNNFTIGINDDITHTSLTFDKNYQVSTDNYTCKFYGLGSDGTVSANKNSIKIIGSHTNLNAQGYFEYDSKKSGSVTISHLRFGKSSTNAPYLITNADFIACHNVSFVGKYDMASDLKQNGIFLLNAPFGKNEIAKCLPKTFFETLKSKNARLFVVDANEVSKKAGLGNRINVVMQTCFFKLTNIIDFDEVEGLLIEAASKTYARKGQKIVDANVNAIKNATAEMYEFDLKNNKYFVENDEKQEENSEIYKYIKQIEHKKGDELPVSSFDERGFVPTNTSKYEKRGIAIDSPCWIKENCLQCNMCAAVCPHAAIRPILVDDEKQKQAPQSWESLKALGVPNQNFRIQIDVANCTGCGVCEKICPAKQKALKMVESRELEKKEEKNLEFSKSLDENVETIFKPSTIKGAQFRKPYFEFSGACAGCGETPYIKLATQLFGHRMVIANATGCSSIYSGSAPTSPFAKNKYGRGPAWASSLFEDNAEFGLGIKIALDEKRETLKKDVQKYLESNKKGELSSLLNEWLENFDDGEKTYQLSLKIAPLFKGTTFEGQESALTKESVFIIGGDGWAYDIGFGGLDQVLASGQNVNILVLDTEVYSNTGGQMSKSTPLGASAKFASSGKRTPKKDLGMIAMSYKNVYVAQVGLGANMNQTAQAFVEAESYNGPSLIIAYSPCINHGINMSESQNEIKRAVECGYLQLYRYDPRLIKEGKNPFRLDSGAPTRDYKEFLLGESRYTALQKLSPELAERLYEESKQQAIEKYNKYLKLAKGEN